jgi:TFIIF-interacting CTD phosphatase-like protein
MTNKINIILDLDQTVISAESSEDFDFKKHNKKAKLFEFYNMENDYIVFERPGLQKFLDYIFERFNVSIWTAASKHYATSIIDNVILKKPNRKLQWVFFSYHCDISSKEKKRTKDLSILWEIYKIPGFNKDNTIILDDYDEVYKTQKENCILAIPFEFLDSNSTKDKFLKKLKKELKNIKEGNPAVAINEKLNTI